MSSLNEAVNKLAKSLAALHADLERSEKRETKKIFYGNCDEECAAMEFGWAETHFSRKRK
ncbi:hypothetical protein GJ688_07535 [Heliobacillus mobilis]|uniref:Uncharacterized protein n=1 Tax=Heliobacterium mobile TaxID=28064 RepID=A0A6I3SJB1_HELMO|nr:hypothetical protein [Heliobacterium mobile]MTV48832.1 hypothetical protein [Heliobacterium mobile]